MSNIEITPVTSTAANLIRGYGNGGFRIGAKFHHEGSIIVFANHLLPWAPPDIAAISPSDLESVIDAAADVEILIFGCGDTFSAAPRPLRDGLREHGIVLEWMDTGAACRTFNLLLSEGRQVAAALIAIN